VLRIEQVILKRLLCEAETRHSSFDALEEIKASADSYDMVVSDMTMPHMAGDQPAEKILKILLIGLLKPPTMIFQIHL